MLDLAYIEFADDDPTDLAQRYPNLVAIRTFSKARGLAGLRVGYAIGSAKAITRLRAAGSPYATSGLSLQLAAMSIATDERRVDAFVDRVRVERSELIDLLTRLGAASLPSQANFVLARFDDAAGVWTRLLEQGVAVRRFDASGPLASALRITCPGDTAAFERLITALESACVSEGDAS
jgi:histidinol-phosphate aminotransferase